jgi:hypothetical protein
MLSKITDRDSFHRLKLLQNTPTSHPSKSDTAQTQDIFVALLITTTEPLMRFLPTLIPTLLLAATLFAQSSIPVTRNLSPLEHPTQSYEQYALRHSFQATSIQFISHLEPQQPTRPDGNLLIVVDTDLQESIAQSLEQYQSDLLHQGISSIQYLFSGSDEAELRNLIIEVNDSEGLLGVFLIGDLPTAWFEMWDDFDNNGLPDYEDISLFPCDLFFSDLDGWWLDENGNGAYDSHELDVEPEIWVGRIKADNLSLAQLQESDLINRYFERNHQFRMGLLPANSTALAYVDDDWQYWGDEYESALAECWDSVHLMTDPNATTAPDYRSARLPADYEYIQVMVHSGPDAHYFYYNSHQDYALLNNWELHDIVPTARFYNLFACSNAHFETPNNMGALYLLDNFEALVTIGSTKTGSMLRFEDYYRPLGAGETFGAAMKSWWLDNVDVNGSSDIPWQRSWFYGMVTQGDPALLATYGQTAVQNLRVETTSQQVHLEWDPLEAAEAYKVYTSTSPYSDFEENLSGTFLGTTWSGPRQHLQTYYKVCAILP